MKPLFKFKLQRVMMYNYTLTVFYGKQTFEAIAEDSPNSEEGLLVWHKEFGLDELFTKKAVAAFRLWADDQGLKYTILDGKRS